MRLFVGIELPEYLKSKIAAYLAPIKKSEKGWESPHDYHQTLLFIGEVSEDDVHDIAERLKRIQFDPFWLIPTAFQFFNRRVMYLGIEKTADLLELKAKVNELFPEFAAKETKSFHPHITVKRWQRYEHAELVHGLSQEPWTPESFKVDSLCLFKSEKNAQNHKYHVIFRVPADVPMKNI